MKLQDRFEQVLFEHGQELSKYLKYFSRNRLGLSADSEDLVNQAVLYALENPEQFKGRSQHELLRYLFWKTKCLLLDETRRNGRFARLGERVSEEAIEIYDVNRVEPSPTATLQRRSKRDAVLQFLQRIHEPDCRQAVELVFLHNLQPRDAAQLMGKSAAEFRNAFRKGFRHLTKVASELKAKALITTGVTS